MAQAAGLNKCADSNQCEVVLKQWSLSLSLWSVWEGLATHDWYKLRVAELPNECYRVFIEISWDAGTRSSGDSSVDKSELTSCRRSPIVSRERVLNGHPSVFSPKHGLRTWIETHRSEPQQYESWVVYDSRSFVWYHSCNSEFNRLLDCDSRAVVRALD
jgi:hypothetical protein